MGGKLTYHLSSTEHRFISEHIAGIMEALAPLFRRHLSYNLLTHMRNKHTEPTEPRPLIQHPDVVAHAGAVLEVTLPQYLDEIWTHRHLRVSNCFTVESRESKQVFEGGWGCKTELVLSGCRICTSVQAHCEIVEDMCRHIKDNSGGKLACWDCPTAFPVFIQHPYSAPVCLAAGSRQEQTQLANILRAATQHQSSVLGCEDSPESRAFLDAVSSLKKLRGICQTEVHPMGDVEEVLVSMVMEEVMPFLKEQVFPRIIVHRSKRRKVWIRVREKLLSEVYRTVKRQIKAATAALKDELSLYRSDVEKLISAGLRPACLLHDHIAHTITEDTCEPMIQSLLRTVIPRIERTLQEVATPACDGFASTWQYFLEMCDDIVELGSKSTSVTDIKKEVLTPLSAFGPGDARMWQCLDKLELNSEGQTWLQETWGVHSGIWRPQTLKAQNALFKVVHMCTVMFRRLLSRYPCSSFDSSQLTAVLCRVKERVVKHLDTQLMTLRSQLILEMMLLITLPTFTHGVGEQDLSRYYGMVNSEQALFIHPDTIFPSILRDNLTSYIQSVMRHSLPQQFMPLPVSPRNPRSSSSSFSEPVYHNTTPGDCRGEQNVFQTPEGSTSGSETLTPSTMSDWDTDTLANSENSENRTLSQLDAGEYVCLNEA